MAASFPYGQRRNGSPVDRSSVAYVRSALKVRDARHGFTLLVTALMPPHRARRNWVSPKVGAVAMAV